MAIERRNPLPVGYYWQDIFTPARPAWDAWLTKNRFAVKVRRTADFSDQNPPRSWFLFEVLSPALWEGPGFPTRADEGTQPQDTGQRPDPEKDPLDKLGDTLATVKTGAEIIAGGVVLLVLGFLATRAKK